HSLATHPHQRIANLNWRCQQDLSAAQQVTPAESTESNNTLDTTQCLHDMIAAWAKSKAKQPAIRDADGQLNYAQMEQRVCEIAASLQAAGIQPKEHVAIAAIASRDSLCAILAILHCGAAYLPIDPASPGTKIASILAHAGCRLLLCDAEDQQRFDALSSDDAISVRCLAIQACDSASRAFSPVVIDCDDPAYAICTSGSTGEPKIVSVDHRGLSQTTAARLEYYRDPPSRFLLVSPLWFDSSIAGLFWTLAAGKTVVIADAESLRDMDRLSKWIEHHAITHTLCLPSLYELLLRYADPNALCSLQSVIVAGEIVHASVVSAHQEFNQHQRHADTTPPTRLYNEYGPTEATVWSSVAELTHHRITLETAVPIGHAAPGCQISVRSLHDSKVELPIGSTGQICIGGSRLSRGYLNDEALTRQRFVENGSLYLSGDRGWIDTDGNLFFAGRIDHQIKVNGQRIEPGEIELVLRQHAIVDEVVVQMTGNNENPLDANDDEALVQALMQCSDADRASMLLGVLTETDDASSQSESIGQPNTAPLASIRGERATIDVRVHANGDLNTLIPSPRDRQRRWMLRQWQQEAIADLDALHDIADKMVAGNTTPHLPRDLASAELSPQEIMEDWQTPIMQAMANDVTQSHGDILEIGFGRGVSAEMIQARGVRSHTIVEMNPHSIRHHYEPWRLRHSKADIRIVQGAWQDHVQDLQLYDGVFFHAFPMNEGEFIEYVDSSATFAEHFFPVAARLLRPGGVFSYLSTEVDSLSRRHQRSLLSHFSEIRTRIQALTIPETTKDAWWSQQMVIVSAIK
ncbi:MAG: amino acid adenylation domain-containing protein, partial [Planctomycetota bacterium]